MNRKFRSVSLWLFLGLMGTGTAYAMPNHAVSESNAVLQGFVCKGVVKDTADEAVIGNYINSKEEGGTNTVFFSNMESHVF